MSWTNPQDTRWWIPCRLSPLGHSSLGKDKRRVNGHIIGESRDGKRWIVSWGGNVYSRQEYPKLFITKIEQT